MSPPMLSHSRPYMSGNPLLTISTVVLAVVAVLFTIYFARPLLFPILLALLLNLLLKPLVLHLRRLGMPAALSAALILIGFGAVVVLGMVQLSGPADRWIRDAPRKFEELETRMHILRRPIEEITRATKQVDRLTEVEGDEHSVPVQVDQPRLTRILFDQTTRILIGGFMAVVLLYFLLAAGDRFLEKLVEAMPTFKDKRRVVTLAREVQHGVSYYLLTVTLINAGLGTAIGTAMWLLGLPNPVLWGVMAALLNFVPYAGATVGAMVVFLVALFSLDHPVTALAAPALYVGLNALEANFITPQLVGRSASLNPVVIFLSLAFWGWMWGIPGALIAVPLLVVAKFVCDHFESLAPVGQFLSR